MGTLDNRCYARLVSIEQRIYLATQRLSLIVDELATLAETHGEIDMAWIDELKEKLAKQTSVIAGVKTMIAELKAKLAEPDVDMGTVQELVAQLDQNTADLADALKEGTAAADEKDTEPKTSVTGDKLEPHFPTDEEQIDPVDRQT